MRLEAFDSKGGMRFRSSLWMCRRYSRQRSGCVSSRCFGPEEMNGEVMRKCIGLDGKMWKKEEVMLVIGDS